MHFNTLATTDVYICEFQSQFVKLRLSARIGQSVVANVLNNTAESLPTEKYKYNYPGIPGPGPRQPQRA